MLDKKIGFCFNNEHDPPPAESVLEDGMTNNNDKKRSPPDKISGNAAKKSKGNNEMCEVMDKGFHLMSTIFEQQKNQEHQSTSIKDAGIAIDLIERLRSELERLKTENGSRKRIKRVKKALAHAYKKLGDVESESDVSSVSSESV